MNSILEKLEQNRATIILAEIGAYLHDLGKARKEFVEHYSRNGGNGWDGHNILSIFPEDLRDLLSKINLKICSEQATLTDFIEKHHKEKESGGDLTDCEIPPLIRLLYAGWNGFDGMDSGIDKGKASVKQSKENIFVSSAFGYEPEENKLQNLDELTYQLYATVYEVLSKYQNGVVALRRNLIEKTKKYYLKFLGETRRSANDVTLWDHSYSVATLFKCAVAKIVTDCSKASFDPLDFDWKILSINLDVLSVLSKGIKIGDIKSYKITINKVFEEAKLLVEGTYPVGNEIYRDTSGIYFLIADIDTTELEKKIYEKVNQIEPELAITITIKNIPDGSPSSNYNFNCNDTSQEIPDQTKNNRREVEKLKKKN